MDILGPEFERLMERVRSGCQDAVREMYDEYAPAIEVVVRRQLPERLRRCYDTMDFTQAVWASFFQVPADQYVFPTPGALVAFLSRMARNKVLETSRQRLGTQKHDMEREVSLDAPRTEKGRPLIDVLPAPIATPSQFVMADERWELLLKGQPPGHRRVLELLRAGHSHLDIARIEGMDRRVIQRLLKLLERYLEAPEPGKNPSPEKNPSRQPPP